MKNQYPDERCRCLSKVDEQLKSHSKYRGCVEPFEPAYSPLPPHDPEQWTDDQWLEWLKATDAEGDDGSTRAPASVADRVVQSVGGQMLGQAMLGLAQAIYGPKQEEVVIVAEGSSEPSEDEPFAVRLNPEHPERSRVIFKSDLEPRD
jgi:hypothetical protein